MLALIKYLFGLQARDANQNLWIRPEALHQWKLNKYSKNQVLKHEANSSSKKILDPFTETQIFGVIDKVRVIKLFI